ncbi:hypothetical protein ACFFJT_15890 [Dyella flava]|nr:hypothetical protein [Dyella flava]
MIDPILPVGDAIGGEWLFQLCGGNCRLLTVIPVAAGMTVLR